MQQAAPSPPQKRERQDPRTAGPAERGEGELPELPEGYPGEAVIGGAAGRGVIAWLQHSHLLRLGYGHILGVYGYVAT
jgi:hypothetical protein